MRLAIYYRNGKITNFHELEQDKDYTDRVNDFNQTNFTKGCSVDVQDYDDGTIIPFLVKPKEDQRFRKREFRNELLSIAASIDSLYDALQWIRKELDEMDGNDE